MLELGAPVRRYEGTLGVPVGDEAGRKLMSI